MVAPEACSTPGANHIGEYIRWAHEFLASSALQYYYDPVDGHPWETGNLPKFVYSLDGKPTGVPMFPKEELPKAAAPDHEKPAGEEGLRACGQAGNWLYQSWKRFPAVPRTNSVL